MDPGRARLAPYLLLLPGVGWLIVFFVIPMAIMLGVSLQEGSLDTGYTLTWNVGIYPEVIGEFWELIVRSIGYAMATTVLTLLIGFPMAYTIAFHGGRLKNALLLVVILPFFVSFVIRTLNWRMILSDNGIVFGTLKDLGLMDPAFHFLATPASVIFGLTYNFLPFMILPLYVALEKIDRRLIEAATDLYASPAQAFWRVTFALSLPGVFAGSLLTFIPAVGDFLNAEIIGAGNPDVVMIGNIIQFKYLNANDYPAAAALGFVLVIGVMVMVGIYSRAVGTERLTG
jgi:spermidine/putrescine transport system permease protein